ncbi:MAG: transketolase C-terminal domain-containing protein [Candidatus Cloacimonetes bacterium]|jgi:transketolase|nr:transketolase family protein [Candidatus Cloacimonadota bacterium]MDD4156068.1 transketolase C-terminal domain-containing protein [Candidatus Cloacimonadota bacterium]
MKTFKKGEVLPIRDGYGKALLHLGQTNPNVIVLDADLAKSTRSDWFANTYPKRFIDVGIAEQNMVGIAAGLALCGQIPFVTTYGVFIAGRAFDQLRNTVCFSNLNVKVIGSHGGISVGPDGGSHQAIEDIALMNVLPNMQVFSPVDAVEAYQITLYVASINSPVFIRLAREATEIVLNEDYLFHPGKMNYLHKGDDAYLISHGTIGVECLKSAQKLKQFGINVSAINCSSIKPFDNAELLNIAKTNKPIFIVEEHLQAGGLGSIISTFLAQHYPRKLYFLNLGDCFGESGNPDELLDKYNLSVNKITDFIKLQIDK